MLTKCKKCGETINTDDHFESVQCKGCGNWFHKMGICSGGHQYEDGDSMFAYLIKCDKCGAQPARNFFKCPVCGGTLFVLCDTCFTDEKIAVMQTIMEQKEKQSRSYDTPKYSSSGSGSSNSAQAGSGCLLPILIMLGLILVLIII